ncbi:MAG: hypothetical protein GX557_01440 [Chloroflexi bacterium]|nr:hypothetical protein [Chloroflexota bacterium]
MSRKAIERELAAYRELSDQQRDQLAAQAPEAAARLAAYRQQDALLRSLPTPALPAGARARVLNHVLRVESERRALAPTRVWATALAAVVLLAVLGTTGYVAADSLPGDALYALKRAGENVQLALTTRQASRTALNMRLEQRRRSEVQALLAERRAGVPVAFVGTLKQAADGAWYVSDIPVALAVSRSLAGETVYLEGVTSGDQVQVYMLVRPTPHGQPEPPTVPVGPGEPTRRPTQRLGPSPEQQPTGLPSHTPRATPRPTGSPTHGPTHPSAPTSQPSPKPTDTHGPTSQPSPGPTSSPGRSSQPSPGPTNSPGPTSQPDPGPTAAPTAGPTDQPGPTALPSPGPTALPGPTSEPGPTGEPGPGAGPAAGPGSEQSTGR